MGALIWKAVWRPVPAVLGACLLSLSVMDFYFVYSLKWSCKLQQINCEVCKVEVQSGLAAGGAIISIHLLSWGTEALAT